MVDIGAGIGEFALLASRRAGSKGKVIAIEPSPEDYATLLLNIKEKGCNNVIPLNMAVSDKPGMLELEFKGKQFYSKSDALDSILHSLNIQWSSVKFMKMDIEGGGERLVIPSSIEIVSQVDFLAMEIHNGYHVDLIPLMKGLGFAFNRVTRRQYLTNSFKAALTHPFAAYSLFKTFRRTGEYPSSRKILTSIDISKSDQLVVGIFTKQ